MKKLLTIAFLLVAGIAGAQQKTPQTISGPGIQAVVKDQLKVDSFLYLPLVDTIRNPGRAGVIIVKASDNNAYLYNGTKWTGFGTAAGLALKLNISDTASMLSVYLRKTDTTGKWITSMLRKTGTDSVFYVKGGTLVFAYIDSTGGGGGGLSAIYNTATSGYKQVKGTDSVKVLRRGTVIILDTTTVPGSTIVRVDTSNFDIRFTGRVKFQDDGGQSVAYFLPGRILFQANDSIAVIGPISKFSVASPSWFYKPVSIWDTLKYPNALLKPLDTTNYKLGVYDVAGNAFKMNWPVTGSSGNGSADSIKHLFVDTSTNRNNYVLTFDSVNHKWILAPPGSGGGGSGTVNQVNTGLWLSGGPITNTGTIIADSAGMATYFLRRKDSTLYATVTALATKQPTGNYITAITGRGTASGPGSAVFTLANSGVSAGTYTNATVTISADGTVSAASSGTAGGITQLTGEVLAGPGSGSQAATLSTVGNAGSYLRPVVTFDTKGRETAVVNATPWGTETTFGRIYKKNYWYNKYDWGIHGTLTIDMNGHSLDFGGGAGTYTAYATLAPFTDLNKWTIIDTFKITAWSGTSYGYGIGTKSASTPYPFDVLARITTTSSGVGTLIIDQSSGTNLVNGGNITVNLNDVIRLTLDYNDSVVTATAYNITTAAGPISVSYNFASTGCPCAPNTGQFAIYEFGGTHTLQGVEIYSNSVKNSNYTLVGDSKLKGYVLTNWNQRLSYLLDASYPTVTIHAGGGDQVENTLQSIDELIKTSPRIVLLSIGSNSVRQGVALSTITTQYDAIVSKLRSAGVAVYHFVIPEDSTGGGVGLTAFKNYIATTYASTYIDVWDTMSTANVLKSAYNSGDGVHPNAAGNVAMKNAIIANGVMTTGLNRIFQYAKTSPDLINSGDSLFLSPSLKNRLDSIEANLGGGGGGGLTGAGTANTIAMWSSSSALTNSGLTQSGSNLTWPGSFFVSGASAGINLQNRNTSTNYWGIYSNPSFHYFDVIHNVDRMTIDTSGNMFLPTRGQILSVGDASGPAGTDKMLVAGGFIDYGQVTISGSNAGLVIRRRSDSAGGTGIVELDATSGLGFYPQTVSGSRLDLFNDGRLHVYDTAQLDKRFSYNSNLHSTFTRYSLIDKAYADSAYGAGGASDTLKLAFAGTGLRPFWATADTLHGKTLLADNGLTGSVDSDSTNHIVLGGALTQNTTLTLGSNDLIFTGASSGSFKINGTKSAAGTYTLLTKNADSSVSQASISQMLTDGNVTSDTYTPTLTNGTNVSSSTAQKCHYLRIGNEVTVTGVILVTPTASGNSTAVGISLPIASTIATARDLSGLASDTGGITGGAGQIQGDGTNHRAQLNFVSGSTSSSGVFFTFTYTIN